jgi:adenylate cyclase class 2
MEKEFETQILDLDVEEIKDKLRKLGAVEELEVFQRRWIFDIDPCSDTHTGEWIRLRQAGDKKPIITYKNKIGKGMSDTSEIEVEVDDFDKTAQILSKAPFKGKYYQENKRHKFRYLNMEFVFDTWPKIPPIMEIEAKSENEVKNGLKVLGLENKDAGHIGTIAIYKHYGIDLHSFRELKF